jgi:hypothetical protein
MNWPCSKATPTQACAWKCCEWFEADTNALLSRPPSVSQRESVYSWIVQQRGNANSPTFFRYIRHLRASLHASTTEKAWSVVQTRCTVCDLFVRADGTFPLFVTFPIQVEPWSRQSNRKHTIIRDAVRHELKERGMTSPWNDSPL